MAPNRVFGSKVPTVPLLLRKAVLSGRIQVEAAVLKMVVERVGDLPTSPGVEPLTRMLPAIVYHFEESIDPLPSWVEDQNPLLDH